jgi:beta-lactamase class D
MSRSVWAVLLIPVLFTACTQGNVTEDNSLKQYFDAEHVNGCFGMFDNGQGHFTIYNLKRFRDSAYLPAATFDVMQSLVGIQTGVVKDDSSLIGDLQATGTGVDSALLKASHLPTDSELCQGHLMRLSEAFRLSCTRAFQELSRRIGKDTLKKWIDSMGYGNKDISSPVDSFWLDNRLAITADEQLGLTKKLYFDQLPFFPRSQKIVRQMMLRESNSNYQLSYKTGTGVRKDGHAFTWYTGWIEENRNPYFFVLNLDGVDPSKNLISSGLNVLKSILKQEGFFQGKK